MGIGMEGRVKVEGPGGFPLDGQGVDGQAGGGPMDLGVDIDYNVPEDLVIQPAPTLRPTQLGPSEHPTPPSVLNKLNEILQNLSATPSRTPRPFNNEEADNEALGSLVRLLKGTGERGEGNSCLVGGSKGSGKTRVSERGGIGVLPRGRGSGRADGD